MTAFFLTLVFTYGTGTIRNMPNQAECIKVRDFMLKHDSRVISAECRPQKGARE